ncbi:pheromone A receptor-domain-containing protein [Aspergillus unguis]
MSPSAETVAMQTLSILAVLASAMPLALHWKNKNLPATMLMVWYMLLNLFNVINAFIWPYDDIQNWFDGAILCDIEVKILVAAYVGVPGTLVCIFRSLAVVLDTSRATLVPGKRQRWQGRAFDLLFCVFAPLIAAVTHIVYQGNRYYIFQVSGCVTSLDQSWVSLVLGYMWPFVVCFIASVYCGLVLFRLRRYRNQFNNIIRAANSTMNKSRFVRLFALALVMLTALLPIQVYVFYMQVKTNIPWHPYSWKAIHGDTWGLILKVPTGGKPYFDRWVPVVAGLLSFFFFGCGKDAYRMYRTIFRPFGLDILLDSLHSTAASAGDANMSSGSRTQLISCFTGRGGQKAQDDLYHSTQSSSTSDNRSCTPSLVSAPHDVEKGTSASNAFRSSEIQSPSRPKLAWTGFKSHFIWLSRSFHISPRRGAIRSIPRLVPTSTDANMVSTSAWAGSSQSRGSIDLDTLPSSGDFIRVKQVIRQEREMQV